MYGQIRLTAMIPFKCTLIEFISPQAAAADTKQMHEIFLFEAALKPEVFRFSVLTDNQERMSQQTLILHGGFMNFF